MKFSIVSASFVFDHIFNYHHDISNLNTNNAIGISLMLCYCSSLSSLLEVSIWNTNNVTNINCMLAACSLLSSLFNISNWNTNNATNMNDMLTGWMFIIIICI